MAKFTICGLEHSGTTLLSDLFRQIPGVDSGFEVGVLMAQSPREFYNVEPFYSNMLVGWGITEEELKECCDTDNLMEFYSRLKDCSDSIDPNTIDLFDKTPRYLAHLETVIQKLDVPVLATYKDPRAVVYSDFKRSQREDFDTWMDEYVPSKHGYMMNAFKNYKKYHRVSPKVQFVSLEAMSLNTHEVISRCFSFVGMEFQLDYLLLKNQRYKNTKGRVVSAGVALEYREKLSSDNKRRIERDFAEFDPWFYD